MTAHQLDAASDSRYWPVPILRALPLLVLGMVTTFVNDHSPNIGLTTFGATTVAGGVILALASYRFLSDPSSRLIAIVQGAVGVAFGLVALLVPTGGLVLLVAVVTGWALITGVLELVAGLRRRGRSALSRDWMIVGGLTLLLAVIYLIVPTDYSKELGGIEKIQGTLTSSTILVGFVGAYGALVAVFLIIQGLSLKWQTGTHESSTDGAHSS